ncbi:MAG: polysaccharide deacetylase family protein [Pseudomonadota bacterium]
MDALTRLFLVILAALGLAPLSAQDGQSARRVAITIDDVPRAPGVFLSEDERARTLIQGLAEAGVEQAAFFLNPGQIAKREGAQARIDAYVKAGHVIANHTADHPRLSQVSAEAFLADIDAAAQWLEGRKSTRPWFRFPYLDEGRSDKTKRDAVRTGLVERGLSNAYVTIDASDWFYEGAAQKAVREGKAINREALGQLFVESHLEAAEFYAALAERTLKRSPAHILLLHETDLVALHITDLVTALQNKGWEIVTVDEAYADPIAFEALRYDTPSAGGTLTEMIAWQRGEPSPRWYARNDTRLAEAEFRTRVLGGEDKSED